ncbi:alpha/beta hydrolase family protein [Meiothermus cerbereus]|uniref:alpha/beta hydrolase family protein n=1 Tax=Meiothermus cerbereus TaxID=65552 RepID=UPI003EEF5E2F
MNKEKLWQRSRQKIRFQNEDMDSYFAWILAHQSEGGSAFGECFYAASQVQDGDPESWYAAWTEVAGRVENLATQALGKGHAVSARETYLRAFTYHQMAAIFLRPSDPRLRETWQKAQRCFRQAAVQFSPPIEPIQIPFEGKSLPGYFLRGDFGTRKTPTLIMIGGGETCAEELYFWVGPAGVRRGYHVLMVDLPGQGGTPFDGLFFRTDSEVPIKAVVDYALTRPEVDPERLGLFGISGGGYMVSRAVSFEKRIKACAASAPIIDVHRLAMAEVPPALHKAPPFVRDTLVKLAGLQSPLPVIAMEKFCWQAGVSRASEALELARKARVERIDAIACPVLCMVGEGESEEQMAQAREFYSALKCPKEFRIFTAADGADAHCQINNPNLMQQVLFDWLDEVFGYRKAG